jgi:hypothetical protein
LRELGFNVIQDFGPDEIRSRYFNVSGRSSGQGGHVILGSLPRH